ncbi:MAG: HAMP domain-containing histidine kinase, partial [Spirochaetales bacterium]|nr:HAMP domain-containing histidine kinase [Candidatus Physcosoma equi]
LIAALKKENDTLKDRISSVSYYSYLLSPDAKCEKVNSSLMDLADMVLQPMGKDVLLDFGLVDEVYGDVNLLCRALTEVVKNAFEYASGKNPPVWSAEVDAEKDMLVLRITNEGFLPSPRPQFFEPWARGDASRTAGGSGLGLPIAYQIMDLHGGLITIDEMDGEVSVVLRLPRKPQ